MGPRGERTRHRGAGTALRASGRAALVVGLIALAGFAATRMLRAPASVRTRALGTSFPAPSGGARSCPDTVEPGCTAATATRAGVTVAWLPDMRTWRAAGLRAGGSGGHGWATEMLRDGDATLTLTSNSPELEVGSPVAIPGAAGVTVRIADGGHRVQLVWSHGATRYVADRIAPTPAEARDVAVLVELWHDVRYTVAVMGWA